MGYFGVKFLSRDFFGFCLKPQGYFWVLIFAPIRSSLSLEILSTSALGILPSWKVLLVPFLREKLKNIFSPKFNPLTVDCRCFCFSPVDCFS